MAINMGLGKLGDPSLVFVRKFRFLLKGNYLDKNFVNKVSVDYQNKTLSFSYYEVYEKISPFTTEIPIHKWGKLMEENPTKEQLTLTKYDGCGNELYKEVFSGLKVLGQKSDSAYADSDASTRDFVLSYETCDHTAHPIDWNNLPVIVAKRPEQKEFKVSHLNATRFIDDFTVTKNFKWRFGLIENVGDEKVFHPQGIVKIKKVADDQFSIKYSYEETNNFVHSMLKFCASYCNSENVTKMICGCQIEQLNDQDVVLESWLMDSINVISINFGELDFSSSDECEMEFVFRYEGVKRKEIAK